MIRRVLTFSDNVQHLHTGADGLWIAHQGGVTHFDAKTGEVLKWNTLDGLPALPALHVATDGNRIAVATPNGVAWADDARVLLRDTVSQKKGARWEMGLMHPMGAGAYVNGVAFVQGKIYAATGGGRMYREGARGFELLELPIPQARLVRMLELPSPKKTLRLFFTTNNSGVLLLSTGGTEGPSLYHWSEEEGLCSRYVTAAAVAGECIAIAVHGSVHVATRKSLVEAPDHLSRWGRVALADLTGPSEHSRIPALCCHGDHLYIGTSVGLYRIDLASLEAAANGSVDAERVDDAPIRHLASYRGELWIASSGGLGRFVESDDSPAGTVEDSDPESRPSLLRSRFFRGRLGGRTAELPQRQVVESSWRRSRLVLDPRWRENEPEVRQVLSMASSPEGLAAGGEAGRVTTWSGKSWTTEIIARLRRPPEVHSLAYDPENGTFWAATRHGLYQRDPRGRWHRDMDFPGRTLHGLSVWGGSVLAIGSAGLHVFVQNEWREIEFPDEPPALFIAATSDNALALAGRPGAGFFVWRSGQPHPVPEPIGVGRANCMAWGEGGELWLGADRGLVRWDGSRAETFSWENDKRDHVTAVLAYAGRIYVGSHAGVWSAPAPGLRPASGEALESQGERWGLLQGLPDSNVTSMIVHGSMVWVGTQGGIAQLE